ncbi:MAG: hypothetical protein WKF30_08965 [Pyrinomonadaceae bacterium]
MAPGKSLKTSTKVSHRNFRYQMRAPFVRITRPLEIGFKQLRNNALAMSADSSAAALKRLA